MGNQEFRSIENILIVFRFANYVVLMSELTDELQQMILQLHRVSHRVDLKMNMKKLQ